MYGNLISWWIFRMAQNAYKEEANFLGWAVINAGGALKCKLEKNVLRVTQP